MTLLQGKMINQILIFYSRLSCSHGEDDVQLLWLSRANWLKGFAVCWAIRSLEAVLCSPERLSGLACFLYRGGFCESTDDNNAVQPFT